MKIQTRPLIYRIHRVHDEIKNGKFPNAKTLAEKLGTSISSISRTIKELRNDFKAPIRFDRKENGYFYSEEYELPFRRLDGDYAEVLICAKILLKSYHSSPLYDKLEEILNDIISPKSKNDETSLFNKIEVIEDIEMPQCTNETWQTICKAITSNKIIKFDYRSQRQEKENAKGTRRSVIPLKIVFDHGLAYLWGSEENTPQIESAKLFSIHKIHDAAITEKIFSFPKDYSFNESIENGKLGAFKSPKGKVKFKIIFHDNSTDKLEKQKYFNDLSLTKNPDGNGTIAEFTSYQYEQILKLIMRLGAKVTPLEPEEFVSEWRSKWLEKIHEMTMLLGM